MEYNGTQYGYGQPKQKRSVGLAVLLSLTAIAVVIGLFAGVLIVNRIVDTRTRTAQLPAQTEVAEPAPTAEADAELYTLSESLMTLERGSK